MDASQRKDHLSQILFPYYLVLGRIIIDRIRGGIDSRLRKEQAGYRRGRGTTEQVFILWYIIEQVDEWQATLYLNFVDFEKAFDSVHHESLWFIMKKYGIPEKIVRIVKTFYEDFQCAVIDQGEICAWFNTKSGAKQGCNMSGFLYLIIMDWIMEKTVRHGENGIRWKLLSSTKQHVQEKTSRMEEEARQAGLKINTGKTKTMRIYARNQEKIKVNEH